MASLSYNYKADIERLAKNHSINFLYPLVEAITNSLQADATRIDIDFSIDFDTASDEPKVNGYTVIDYGHGFKHGDIRSFHELKSAHKKDLGCKGFGRVTWLVVFNDIYIKSQSEELSVDIHFHADYDTEGDCKVVQAQNPDTFTSVSFQNVALNYCNPDKPTWKDRREDADKNAIKEHLLNEIMALLYVYTIENGNIAINLLFNGKKVGDISSERDLSNFNVKDYVIKGQDFKVYYAFTDSRNPSITYIANTRTVEQITDLPKIPNEVDDGKRLIMLVTSSIFNLSADDIRKNFTINDTTGIDRAEIDRSIKKIYSEILLEHYPQIADYNERVIARSIEQYPYLTKYIDDDSSIIKDDKSLVNDALTRFHKEKNHIRDTFNQLLKEKDLDIKQFNDIADQITDLQARELGEYIAFRQQIILALQQLSIKNKTLEDKLHDLFMLRGKTSDDGGTYDNNIWLLDDKFTSFNYVASDKSMAFLKKRIVEESDAYGGGIEPDLAMLYSRPENENRDAVLIEFKGIGTSNKGIAISELPRNLRVLRKNFPNLQQIWGYIITEIDDSFIDEIEAQARYQTALCNGKPMYYGYLGSPTFASIYFIDINTIVEDAAARNKTFLDIITNVDMSSRTVQAKK